jgi:hypothetical protein
VGVAVTHTLIATQSELRDIRWPKNTTNPSHSVSVSEVGVVVSEGDLTEQSVLADELATRRVSSGQAVRRGTQQIVAIKRLAARATTVAVDLFDTEPRRSERSPSSEAR